MSELPNIPIPDIKVGIGRPHVPKTGTKIFPENADVSKPRQVLTAMARPEQRKSEDVVRIEQIRREVSGRLYGNLLTAFSETPGITKDELMKKVSDYAKEHKLAGRELGKAVGMVGRFCQAREVVQGVREQYPDDRALFEHTFGFAPQGEVKVIMGTIDIAFHIPNINDRAKAITGDSTHEPRVARTAPGVLLEKVHESSLNGLVIALEYSDTPDVLAHERQHVINNSLLRMNALMNSDNETIDTVVHRIQSGDDPETAAMPFFNSLKAFRLQGASDEIIASVAGNERSEQIKKSLTYQQGSYGETYRSIHPNLEKIIVEKIGKEHSSIVIETGNKILGAEYDQSINDCVDAFQKLRTNGVSQEQATGYLSGIPPQEWNSFVANMTPVTK